MPVNLSVDDNIVGDYFCVRRHLKRIKQRYY